MWLFCFYRMHYLYFIYSSSADKYYVGHSNDPWRRLVEHNTNTSDKYTGKYEGWNLVAVFAVSENRGDADRIEKFIKKQKSRHLILRMIDAEFVGEGILSQLVRVPHVRD